MNRCLPEWVLGLMAFCLVPATLVPVTLVPATALAYTPDSPVVRKMADRAVKILEDEKTTGQYSDDLGARALRGLACYKYYHRYGKDEQTRETTARNNAQVKAGVAAARRFLAGEGGLDPGAESYNYSIGLAVIFLCEIDDDNRAYATEIEGLLAVLFANQRSDGSWSYKDHKTGDTSQTQYGILGTWYAKKKGYQVPQDTLARSSAWLTRTQAASGAFAYQPNDPGAGARASQVARLSMSPAALGCLYITADLAGIPATAKPQKAQVFRSTTAPAGGGDTMGVDAGAIRRAIRDGNQYYAGNFKLDIGRNFHYYLYSLERYHAMKAASEQRLNGEAKWYDGGVDFLAKTEEKTGGWGGTRGLIVSSSFSLLFLLRSMEIAIQESAGGQARGGYGLPEDLTRINADNLKDGQVVGPSKETSISRVLEMIRNGDPRDLVQVTAQIDDIPLDEDRNKRKVQVDQLRELLSKGAFQQRIVAARAMAASADVDNVPHLIYALTDGDNRVTLAARDGLRLISRKFGGYGLTENPSPPEKELAARQWKQWYHSVRPDAKDEDANKDNAGG